MKAAVRGTNSHQHQLLPVLNPCCSRKPLKMNFRGCFSDLLKRCSNKSETFFFSQNRPLVTFIHPNVFGIRKKSVSCDEFLCQRQICCKCLAMDLRRVSHSDNFHNILCPPPPPQGRYFVPAISLSIRSCLFLLL